jgi:hypothetical protein
MLSGDLMLLEMTMRRESEMHERIDELRDKLARARAVLATHEWGAVGHCHECARHRDAGHTDSCRLRSALQVRR